MKGATQIKCIVIFSIIIKTEMQCSIFLNPFIKDGSHHVIIASFKFHRVGVDMQKHKKICGTLFVTMPSC